MGQVGDRGEGSPLLVSESAPGRGGDLAKGHEAIREQLRLNKQQGDDKCYIGSMRAMDSTVLRLPVLIDVGLRVRALLLNFFSRKPHVIQACMDANCMGK